MRTGWRETPARGQPRVEAPNHAKRRAQLSAAFPGETLVIPTGREKVRANDTLYPFRPGQRLHVAHRRARPRRRPDHAAERRRPRRDALHPAALAARHRRVLPQRRLRRAVDRAAAHARREGRRARASRPRTWPSSGEALAGCAPARTRVLRGYDQAVDAAVAPYDTGRGRHPRPGAGDEAVRAAPGQGRVGGRPAAGRDRRDRARLRGRRPDPAGRPRRSASACIEGDLRPAGPARRQRPRATPRSSAPARTRRSCTGSATPAPPRRASCCSWTWAWRTATSTPPTSPARCR